MKVVKKFPDDEPLICKLKLCQVTSHPGLLSLLEKNSGSLYIPDKNFLSLSIHIYGRVKQECSKNVKDISFDVLEDAIPRSPRVLKFVEDLVGDLIDNSKISLQNYEEKIWELVQRCSQKFLWISGIIAWKKQITQKESLCQATSNLKMIYLCLMIKLMLCQNVLI